MKLLIKLQESQKLHQRIIQKRMKKKYLEKDTEQRQKIIDDPRLYNNWIMIYNDI